jgi:hypothetical protein
MPRKPVKFEFEYVTSAVSLFQDDGIVVHVVNDNPAKSVSEVIVYQNTGAGAVTAAATGPADVTPTWTWGLGYTIPNAGEYWLRVRVASEYLVPKASFERLSNGIWLPLVTYRPGDFAIFKLRPTRKRIW